MLNGDIGFYDLLPGGGNPVTAGTSTSFLSATFGGSGAGVDLLDMSVLGQAREKGMYGFLMNVHVTRSGGGVFAAGDWAQIDLSTTSEPLSYVQQSTSTHDLTLGSGGPWMTASFLRYLEVGGAYLTPSVVYHASFNLVIVGTLSVQRVY